MAKIETGNKVCLITGATSGIGLASAHALAQMGIELFLVCRNLEKGERIIEEIKAQSGNDNINLLIGDLSSLEDVRQVAQSFLQFNRPLHILLNNAGVFNFQRKLSIDGYEEMFAVNHLAHFLLTNLLLDCIKSSSPARIVNVASGAHMLVKNMNFTDLDFKEGFRSLKVYSHSKLANLLFTHELSNRLEGSKVTVNSVDPGEVKTSLAYQNGRLVKILSFLIQPFLQSPNQGARTSIYMSTSSEVEGISGRNYRDCKEKQPKPWAMDDTTAQQLWDISTTLCNLQNS